MKLELKHLTPYLPYNLNVASGGEYDKELPNIGIMGTHYDVYAPNNYTIYQLRKCENGVFKYMGIRPIKVKPMLRPLSSITKEESKYLFSVIITDDDIEEVNINILDDFYSLIIIKSIKTYGEYTISIDTDDYSISAIYEDYGSHSHSYPIPYEVYEWLISKHFDLFGLIKNNLAIELK